MNHSKIKQEDVLKTTIIRKEIFEASQKVKEKYPVLKYQNAIGLGIFLISIAMIVLSAVAYLKGMVNEWFMLFWVAFWTSLLHELEHDLIHFLYFDNNKFIQNIMMLGVWVFKPLTINPWMRRELHLHHHKFSGTQSDLEERALTNGEKWGFKRLITTADIFLGGILRFAKLGRELSLAYGKGDVTKNQMLLFIKINKYSMLPFTFALYLVFYFFVSNHFFIFVTNVLGIDYTSSAWVTQQLTWIDPLVYILLLPNLFRMFCLHFITSNIHYYGDVEAGNVLQQTQILNKWYFLPFQLFCFNFGSTHAIHHFIVNETFYVRQLTSNKAHKIMKEQGVRFNDIGSFERENRYFAKTNS